MFPTLGAVEPPFPPRLAAKPQGPYRAAVQQFNTVGSVPASKVGDKGPANHAPSRQNFTIATTENQCHVPRTVVMQGAVIIGAVPLVQRQLHAVALPQVPAFRLRVRAGSDGK